MNGINVVHILKIEWLDKEAEVLFELCSKRYWAFSHSCFFQEGNDATVFFDFLEDEIPEAIFGNGNREEERKIIATDIKWAYRCYGQIVDLNPVTIDCGTIHFYYGDWIHDESVIGAYVYILISRLNINALELINY